VKTTDFSFNLPAEQIAQFPPEHRGESRLMILDRQNHSRTHSMVKNLPDLIEPGSLLVFNNSKVRKARLFGTSVDTDAEVEFLLLNNLGEGLWKCMIKRAKRRRVGSRYVFAAQGSDTEVTKIYTEDAREAVIEREDNEFRYIRFNQLIDDAWLDAHGHIPLPPYIKREDELSDSERYQTVYAKVTGSSAAPTAGLHYTEELLAELQRRGIERTFVTLHVGLGTFLPVRAEHITDHVMHEESYSISEEAAEAVNRAKRDGRKVIAVGTTSVRTLESAWTEGQLPAGEGATSIFIYPGYQFNVGDSLFTNFHTPESTLLMLVSAFAGKDFIMQSYEDAVNEGYRFFSYGDAMLIK
jgi:S-adenosylmethionine:tRNA ribosyltransferase-isomerase